MDSFRFVSFHWSAFHVSGRQQRLSQSGSSRVLLGVAVLRTAVTGVVLTLKNATAAVHYIHECCVVRWVSEILDREPCERIDCRKVQAFVLLVYPPLFSSQENCQQKLNSLWKLLQKY